MNNISQIAKIKNKFLPDFSLDKPHEMIGTVEGKGVFDFNESLDHHMKLREITDDMNEQQKLDA